MMRHHIHSFRIFQPQPSRGKKRRILTRSKPHTAGNTSSGEDNTTQNRINKIQHRNYQLVLGPILRSDFLQSLSLVPASSGSYPQIRFSAVPGSCWFRVLSSDQTFCSPWFLLVPGPILRSDPRSLRICRFRVPTQSRCLQLLTPAGLGSSLQVSTTFGPMGAAITKQALDDIHTSRLPTPPHMRKMQGSQAGHNIFRPGLQLGRILKTGGVRRRAPGNTTGVPGNHKELRPPYYRFFPATNPDIALKEIKAFYPLQTPGETQDPCLSKSPRLHPSTSCKKRKFPVKDSRIRQSTRKSSYARALVPRSLQVLKDKSTSPPREVASTPQQRSAFLQGPVTGLRTLYPADECQSSLKHQQVHLRRTLHHWEKPTWVTRPESKSCRPLKYKIKVPNPTRSPSNRSETWKYSSRPRSTIWKNDSPPGSNTVHA
ncbi:hypothetical protein HID58_092701 [Brassica napus]|uniref:Uncharacterized protein n=1 Tax=Brassica napus TaxID=3708 RepID=A0ABQ7XDR4_BRANA|nr:hypothetical protein HID58_092701 [Brassica napus]